MNYLNVLYPIPGKMLIKDDLTFESLWRVVHDCQGGYIFPKQEKLIKFSGNYQEFVSQMNALKKENLEAWTAFQYYINLWWTTREKTA